MGLESGTANRVFIKFQVRVFLLVFPDFARSSSSSCFKIGDANIQVRVFSFFRFFKFEFKFFSNNLNFLDSQACFCFSILSILFFLSLLSSNLDLKNYHSRIDPLIGYPVIFPKNSRYFLYQIFFRISLLFFQVISSYFKFFFLKNSSSSSCFKFGDANIQVRVFSFFRFFKFEFELKNNSISSPCFEFKNDDP